MKIFKKILVFVIVLGFLSVNVVSVSEEKAVESLEKAEENISVMRDQNLPTASVNYTLFQGYQALRRARFAELVNSSNSTLAAEARRTLHGFEDRNFSYSSVMEYTEQVLREKRRIEGMKDRIKALELEIKEADRNGVNVSEPVNLLISARTSFYDNQFSRTESLIEQTRSSLEDAWTERSLLNLFIFSDRSFVSKHWNQILVFLMFLSVGSAFSLRYVNYLSLRQKVERMRSERESVEKMLNEAQRLYFKEEKISKTEYDVRKNLYDEKLGELDTTIPVLEEKLEEHQKFFKL